MAAFRLVPGETDLSGQPVRVSASAKLTLSVALVRGEDKAIFRASGLEGLEQMLDAMPRTSVGSAMASQRRIPKVEGNDAAQKKLNEISEFSGVWFSRGRLHGQVDLSSEPHRGWFDVFAAKAA